MITKKNISRFMFIITICLGFAVSSSCRKTSTTGKSPDFFYKNKQMIELCEAIADNDEKKVDELLKHGVDINRMGKEGMTPMLWAFTMHDKKIFEMVLKKGGNPNIRYYPKTGTSVNRRYYIKREASVMTRATKSKDPDYLKLALKYGGNPNYQNLDYDTLLFIAILSSSSLEKVKLLVDAGADINHQDVTNKTPTIDALLTHKYSVAYYLLRKGADPMLTNDIFSVIDLLVSFYQRENEKMKRYKSTNKYHLEKYEYLVKSIDFLRKQGYEIDLKTPYESKFILGSLPKDWLEKNEEKAAKKVFKNNGSKPTIYNPVIPNRRGVEGQRVPDDININK
jgi:ankyrin repeat protein